jgi:hypothetical protein
MVVANREKRPKKKMERRNAGFCGWFCFVGCEGERR